MTISYSRQLNGSSDTGSHTAMAGSSANVSGSSGEGVRLRGGSTGIAGINGRFFGPLPLALRKIGASFSSPLAGGEDKVDESESAMMGTVMCSRLSRPCGGCR